MKLQFFQFKTRVSLDEIKREYRDLMKANHPDLAADAADAETRTERSKLINAEYDAILAAVIADAFDSYQYQRAQSGQTTWTQDLGPFAEMLRRAMDLDGARVEIIGFWIYVFGAYEVREQLKAAGFWWCVKHRAWVYSGTKRHVYKRSRMTLDEIRANYGARTVEREEREPAEPRAGAELTA